MAITRYAGDRFTIADGETKPTGVLDGAYLIDTGNLTQFVRRTVGGSSEWTSIAGGGGGSPGGSDTQVQFNDNGAFGGSTGLTFDGQRLYANNFQLSGILYDSNASVGEGGMVLANEGQTGVHWKNIESVLSGVGGSGVANYVARWSDEDTLTTGTLVDNGTKVGIGITGPLTDLHIAGVSSDPPQGGNWASLSIGDDYWPERRTQINAYRSLRGGDWDHMGISFQPHTSSNHLVGPTITGMVIDYDGNVGIGTNSPSYPLDVEHATAPTVSIVSSAANVSPRLIIDAGGGSGTADPHIKFDSDGVDWSIGTDQSDSDKFKFAASSGLGSSVMTIQRDGNVGIGTTAPGKLLELAGGGLRLPNGYSIDWNNENTRILASHTSGFMRMDVGGTSNVLYLNSSGNVGIGTNNPSVGLQVGNSVLNETKLVVFNSEGGVPAGLTVQSRVNRAKLHVKDNDSSAYVIAEDGKANFGTAGSLSTNNITVLSDGNVGIGETTPNQPLVVVNAVDTSYVPTISAFTNNLSVGVELHHYGLRAAHVTADGSTGLDTNQKLMLDAKGTGPLILQTYGGTGAVGIGTASPGHKLDVNGVVVFSPNTAGKDTHKFTTNASNDGRYFIKSDTTTKVDIQANGDSYFNGGNVGIGITNPGAKLHVNGDVSATTLESTVAIGTAPLEVTSTTVVTNLNADLLDGQHGAYYATASNLIVTGAYLTSEIAIVSGIAEAHTDLTATGHIIDLLSGDLITTGQTLTTNLILTGAIVDDVSGNLITTGTTNAAGIVTNASDIADNTANLILTGAIVDDVSGNLITTGQYLTDEINTVSGLIPATVIDGGGTADYIPKWEDGNTIGDSVIYDDGSNIGIGTDDPQAPLHVLQTTGDNNDTGLIVETTNTAERARIVLRHGNAEDYVLQSNYYGFHIGPASKLEVINIERVTHHIGIGTKSPSALFDIRDWGGNVDTRMHLMNTSQTSNGRVTDILFGKDNGANLIGQLKYYYHTTQANRRIELNHFGENGQLTILDGGNVGIGITNPGNKLQVNGSVSITEYLKHDGDADTYLRFETNKSTLYGGGLGLVVASGKVGIGTATSTYNLKVQGTSKITGTLSVGGVFTTDGNTTLGTIAGNSHTLHGTLDLDDSKLTLGGSGGTAGYHLQTDGSGNVSWAAGGAGTVTGTGTANYVSKWTGASSQGNSIIQDNGSMVTISGTGGDGTEILRLRGTASGTFNWISAALHANLTAGETSIHLFGKAESTKNSGYIGYRYYGAASNANLVTIGHYGSNYLVNIAGDGNVGIGTTNPGSLLDVNGAFKAGVTTLTGALTGTTATFSGTGKTVLTVTGSDTQSTRIGIASDASGMVGDGWLIGVGGSVGDSNFPTDDFAIHDSGIGTQLKIEKSSGKVTLTGALTVGGNVLVNSGSIILYGDGDALFAGTSANMSWDRSDSALEFQDNAKIKLGTGDDLQIYHDGSHSYITESGTGNLYIRASQSIALQKSDGTENYLTANNNGAVSLYHNNYSKLATTSTGIDVTGVITTDGLTTSADINFGDNDKAVFGASSDLQIYHDGSNSYIDETGTGNLRIRANDQVKIQKYTGENMFVGIADGAASMYYDNAQKIATTSTGVIVTGGATFSGDITRSSGTLNINGSSLALNNAAATKTYLLGTDGGSVQLRHNDSTKLATTSTGTETTGLGSITNTAAGVQTALKLSNNTAGASNRVAIDFYTASTKYGTIEAGYGAASPEMNFKVGNAPAQILKLNSTGATVVGQLSATTKSFLIDHPDPEKKKKGIKLQHGSLEGPEHSVFVRGKSSSSIIPLPDYWRYLIDEDSITVQLTSIGQHQKLYVKKVTHDSVMVGSEGNGLNYFYTVFAERIDTGKLKVEI